MNLNIKIISLIILSFFVISSLLTYISISHLKQNQTENIGLFKEEFLEISRELFESNSTLFFSNIDAEIDNIESKKDPGSAILDVLKKIDPISDHTIVYDIVSKKIITPNSNYTNQDLFTNEILDGYGKENILNQKIDFNLDNFNQFIADETGQVTPSEIHFKIYKDAGLIVGDVRIFLSGKVRIEFVKRQNQLLIDSNIKSSILASLIILIIIIMMMIIFMKEIVIKPLKIVASGLKLVKNGDFETKLNINTKDEIGKISGAFNSMISKLKISTNELIEEKARLLASINSLSFAFIILDMNHKILLGNSAMLDLFKIKDINSITLDDISKQLGEKINIKDEVERYLNKSKIYEIKEIIFDKKILRCIMAEVVLPNKDKGRIGYVLLFEDVTEARVMDRSRDEFFDIASHELRTPLTAIRWNSEMIINNFSEKITDPSVREMLLDINQSSVRLINIVNDFLEASRLEQGKLEMRMEKFDIVELATKVVRGLEGIIREQEIILELEKPKESLPKIFGDKNRIEQVLVNLIGNSIKFTKIGSIKISLEISDEFIMVSVKDTGIGISEQNKIKLFKKFQQAGIHDVIQGTGLGLYISQLIISGMGGKLSLISSEIGKGSTFAFTIPINPNNKDSIITPNK